MTLNTEPTHAPSWIVEALNASWGEGRSFQELAECLATEIAARLPLEALTLAAVLPAPSKRCAAIVEVLTAGNTRAVRHAELFESVAVALDEAGVPRLGEAKIGLPGRVRWLAQIAAERAEAVARLSSENMFLAEQQRAAIEQATADAEQPTKVSITDTDDDLPFDPPTIEPPAAAGWSLEPPTLNERLRWPYWWIKKPCCPPELLMFNRTGEPQNGADGEPLTPSDLIGVLWSPAVPPTELTYQGSL